MKIINLHCSEHVCAVLNRKAIGSSPDLLRGAFTLQSISSTPEEKASMDKLFSNYTWYLNTIIIYKLEGISAAMSTYFAGVLVPVGDIMASVGALLILVLYRYVTVVEFTAMLVPLSVAGRSGEVSPVPTNSFSPS